MKVPSVHINGTSRDQLIGLYIAAGLAVQTAIEKLAEAAPNARDYYVQGPDAYPTARREHEARMHKLADVVHELRELAEAIDQ